LKVGDWKKSAIMFGKIFDNSIKCSALMKKSKVFPFHSNTINSEIINKDVCWVIKVRKILKKEVKPELL